MLFFMRGVADNRGDQFCYECPECGGVFEHEEQFKEERPGRTPAPPAYLKTALLKWKIFKKFSFNEIAFLGNVVVQFQEKTGKSVNYPCFLHNYFEAALSKLWPRKKETIETLVQRLPKSFATRRCAKRAFDTWMVHNGAIPVSNPTPAFV